MPSHGHLHHHRGVANLIAGLVEREAAPQVATTVVYVTAPQTFAGPVMYTTLTGGLNIPRPTSIPPQTAMQTSDAPEAIAPPQPSSSAKDSFPDPSPSQSPSPSPSPSSSPSSSPSNAPFQSQSSSPSFGSSPSSTSMSNSQSTGFVVPSNSVTRSTPTTSALSSSSSTATPETSQSSGMSGGAKAGLALGLLLGIGALLVVILILYRRKRRQNRAYSEMDDDKDMFEKSHFSHDGSTFGKSVSSVRTVRTMSTAPRLSLRPVTQFLPNLTGDRKSSGNPLAMASTPRNVSPNGQHLTVGYGAKSAQANDPANPFGNHAESSDQEGSAMSNLSPASAQRLTLTRRTSSTLPAQPDGRELAAAMLTGAAVGAVGSSAASVAESKREDTPSPKPEPLNISTSHSRSPSPASLPSSASTEFTAMSSIPPTPLIPQGASGQGGQVHRVQLDFKPSMDDELPLQAGQLVRLLHEYDDGWALCVRLDRPQQGVAPRTCLSTRSVKPRPAGPSMNGPPAGMRNSGRSMGPPVNFPGGSRPGSAATSGRSSPATFGQQPRSISPASGYGVRGPLAPPGAGNRSRAGSTSSQMTARSNAPTLWPGPGTPRMTLQSQGPQRNPAPGPNRDDPPGRKPVPGQAI